MPGPATTSCASTTATVASPTASRRRSTARPEATPSAEAPEPSLIGGDGNDAIDGNGGADTGLLGAGDDSFVWDPGDGSDVVEGQDGTDDALQRRSGAEQVDLSANGNRLRFFRTQGDHDGHRRRRTVDFNALGGADSITVNDLSGTDVNDVRLDLAATLGGADGGQADRVTVNGTNGKDAITVSGNAAAVAAPDCRHSCRSSTRSRPTNSASTASPAMTRLTPPGSPAAPSRSSSTAKPEATPSAEAPEPRA